MWIIITIASIVVLAIAVVLILAATKPDIFRIERRTTINATSDKIFPSINDFKNWPTWSPWEKLDPAMKRSLTGSPSGKGAIYEWDSTGKAGKGKMEILNSTPVSKVTIKLDFLKPFEGHNTAEFTLLPKAQSTEIIWSMHGPCAFPMKIMHVFLNMDKLIGKDFESGVANLKEIAEK